MKKQGAFDSWADAVEKIAAEHPSEIASKKGRLAARLLRVAGRAQTCEGSNLYMEGEMVKLARIIHQAQKLMEKAK